MSKNITKYVLTLLCIIAVKAKGQNVKKPEVELDNFILKLAPLQTEDLNYEEIYENLYALYQNPIDINRADVNELRTIFFLTEIQIKNIIEHKNKFGDFLSLYELQAVEGLNNEDIKNILPFIYLKEKYLKNSLKNIKPTEHYFVFRADQTLEKSKAFSSDSLKANSPYAGSAKRFYTRYRMSHPKDYSLGFISEKDPGEKNFFDYATFHLQLQNKGMVKNLVVGDYLMQFGQGLIFSAGFAPGKGNEPVYSTRRSNIGIKPYNSIIENGSFRGAATTIKVKNIEFTAMAASNKRDASVKISDDQEEFFSSILTGGFHRTETEIANKNILKEQNLGANILYKLSNLQVGFSGLASFFDKSFQKRPDPYNKNEFIGKANYILGPNLSLSWQNFNFFGEAARSSSGGYGYIAGLVGSLNAKTEWALNIRNYQPNFHTFYGSAFAEGSRNINEKGIYTGLKYTIKKGLVVSGFYDSFRFPWLKFGVDIPSQGYDYQLRISRQPNKIKNHYLAFHHETKQKNAPNNINNINSIKDYYRNQLIFGNEYIYKQFYKFQTKIQYNNYQFKGLKKSNGVAIIQDFEGKIKKFQYKTRVAYFNTDDYDSRVYAYENDVLYAVSFPAYYGKGFRYYVVAKIPIYKKIDAWIRLARTNVLDRAVIGSGNDQINDNKKTDLKVQLKYSF
jgi:hypothetical protein